METPRKTKRQLKGTVVSNKMKDTIVVSVERYTKHPKYKKYMNTRTKYMAHDAGNTKQIGEQAVIEESRPMSRHKRFILVK